MTGFSTSGPGWPPIGRPSEGRRHPESAWCPDPDRCIRCAAEARYAASVRAELERVNEEIFGEIFKDYRLRSDPTNLANLIMTCDRCPDVTFPVRSGIDVGQLVILASKHNLRDHQDHS